MLFARFQSFQTTMKSSPTRAPSCNFARLDVAVAAVDKNNLASAGLQDASRGNHELLVPSESSASTFTNMPGLSCSPGFEKTRRTCGRSRIHVHLRDR